MRHEYDEEGEEGDIAGSDITSHENKSCIYIDIMHLKDAWVGW